MTPSADRDRRIADHAPIARRIARRVARRCPTWVSAEDLVSAAMLGLAEAAARYDDSRSEPFLVFAVQRIRGAVLDELRRGDILPRRVRKLARQVDATVQALEAQLGAPPAQGAVAAALGVSEERYHAELAPLASVKVGSLDDLEHAPPVSGEASPRDQVEQRRMVARLRAGLERLDRRDALILSLLYGDELSGVEVGQVLGVSTSRVCQLHARALARLRAAVEPAAPSLAA